MRLIIKGILLGLLTACLTTVGDALIGLSGTFDFAIPQSYPFVLLLINTLVWVSLGTFSGVIMWCLEKYVKRNAVTRFEDLLWFFFYILPFLSVYAVLGSVRVLFLAGKVYDDYLSILWILILFGALIILTVVRVRREKPSPIFFLPEIALVIAMLYFCSNVNLGFKKGPLAYYLYGVISFAVLYSISVLAALRYKRTPALANKSLLVMVFLVAPVAAFLMFRVWQQTVPVFTIPEAAVKRLPGGALPPIILIVLDTARADRLSIYGYPKETSPNLARFAKDALLFRDCYASSSWTLPSHASLFTGLYPSEHGAHYAAADNREKDVRSGGKAAPTEVKAVFASRRRKVPTPIYDGVPSLVESLRAHGYLTSAIVSNRHVLHPYFGFAEGFDCYSSPNNIGSIRLRFQPISHLLCLATYSFPEVFARHRIAGQINADIFAWLEQFSSTPFFLFINYMDPHIPYFPPSPFDKLYEEERRSWIDRAITFANFRQGKLDLATYTDYEEPQYDGELGYLDWELGKLFREMRELGIYDPALIVVTSDHGELLGEHGLLGHAKDMYEEAMRVPLLVKYPFSSRTGIEARPIQMVDILPTVFDILDLPLPSGLSGTPYGLPERPIVGELFRSTRGLGIRRVIYKGRHKLMQHTRSNDLELYDLQADPHEGKNLSRERDDIASVLLRDLTRWREEHPPRGTAEEPEAGTTVNEIMEGLKALGYVR